MKTSEALAASCEGFFIFVRTSHSSVQRNPFDKKHRQFFLVELQYLGFRFHGWQKQPGNIPTVERMLQRTLRFVLDHSDFKILAAGRTDAKVSAAQTWIQLIIEQENPIKIDELLADVNTNLPSDIRALSIKHADADLNIIQEPKLKEYIYLFTHGKKNHPFAAPLMVFIKEKMDIELIKTAARMFEGTHNFWSYTYKPSATTQTISRIDSCRIEKNNLYTASFFPEDSYLMRVSGAGFKRHQIRLMMGILIDLGVGKVDIDFFEQTLDGSNRIHLSHIAPASGLILQSSRFL